MAAVPPDSLLVARVLAAVQTRYDAINGGFGGAPKFPPSLRLELLMATAERFADPQVQRIVLHSLERMAAGGIYDQIGGGFHRYATDAEWRVPRMAWHTDAPRLPGDASGGIIALAYLDTVRPSGGGTVAVAGSHRLLPGSATRIRSRILKRRLRRHGYFRELWCKDPGRRQRLLRQWRRVDGVDVRLEELTGAAGDVVLVDARVLHSLAPNCLARPRIMARGFFASVPYRNYLE